MRLPNKFEQREILVRKIEHEIDRLCIASRNLGEVKLDKPIRDGWFKHLVLREDVARRKDADVYQEIIDVAGRWIWGSDKKVADKKWLDTERKKKNWQWAGLAYITKDKYNVLSPKAKKFFVEYEWKWTPWQGSLKRYYCLVPQHYYVPSYTRSYITHRKIVDSELHQRIDELSNRLLSNELYVLSDNVYKEPGGLWWRKLEERRMRRKVKKALRFYDEEKFDQELGYYNLIDRY